MENNELINYIITACASILGYISSKQYFIPWIVQLYNWLKNKKDEIDEKQIDVTNEIHKIKLNEVEYYEKTFETLLHQIEELEDQLKDYSNELKELRSTILNLNAKLYNKSMVILDLQKKCCLNEDCPNRICCENKIQNLNSNETVK